jgi:Zinc-finger associated domain (zf-AD)/Zinc finger, C2H2 type
MEDCENDFEIDGQLTCRCCLFISTKGDDLKNLFSTILVDGKLLALPHLISKVFGVIVSAAFCLQFCPQSSRFLQITKTDGLPTRICIPCMDQVQKNFTFRKKFERTNKTLHQILKIPHNLHNQGHNFEKKIATASVDCQTEPIGTKSTLVQTNVIDWKHATTQSDSLLTRNSQCQTERATTESVHVNTDLEGLVVEDFEKPLENADLVEFCEEEYLVGNVDEEELVEIEDIKPTMDTQDQESNSATDAPISSSFCQICRKEVEDLQQHKDIHARTYRKLLATTPMYNCGSCRSIFLTLSALDQHITYVCQPIDYSKLVASSNEQIDICLDDSAVFVSVKLEKGVYNCDHCNSFWDLSLENVVRHCTTDHLLVDDNSSAAPHTCGICFQAFPTAIMTRTHILSHANYLSCPMCDYKCNKLGDLVDHELTEHTVTTKRDCRHCGHSIGAGEQHDSQCPERRYQCSHCDKRFLKRGTLKIHERIHEGKRVECEICGRRFVQSGDLKSHLRIHNGLRPYKCEICGKQFRISSHRVDHMSTHSTVNEFQCTLCEKMFKSKRILAEHGRIHDADNRKFKCNVCFKTFLRNTHLQSHYRVHQPKGTEK